MAVVALALALAKVTVPLPLTLDQVTVRCCCGKPASEAAPLRPAEAGRVMVYSNRH